MMLSGDYRERFKAEYYQTAVRVRKLRDTLKKLEHGELSFTPNCEKSVLYAQLAYMVAYLNTLYERAEQEGVMVLSPECAKGD